MNKNIIVAPSKRELQFVLEGLRRRGHSFVKSEKFYVVESLDLEAVVFGVGAPLFVRKMMEFELEEKGLDRYNAMILVGGAGALHNQIPIGTVGWVQNLVDLNGKKTSAGPSMFAGNHWKLATVSEPLDSPSAVNRLKALSDDAEIVSMESHSFWARSIDYPFPCYELRAVTDHCAELDVIFWKNLEVSMDKLSEVLLKALEDL